MARMVQSTGSELPIPGIVEQALAEGLCLEGKEGTGWVPDPAAGKKRCLTRENQDVQMAPKYGEHYVLSSPGLGCSTTKLQEQMEQASRLVGQRASLAASAASPTSHSSLQ